MRRSESVSEITVSFSRTISAGVNTYESSKIHMSYSREVREEDRDEALVKEYKAVRRMVMEAEKAERKRWST